MSEKKEHTPGPWHWEMHPDRPGYIALATDDLDVILVTSSPDGDVVAHMYEADANLIEAAPDLLAVAEALAEAEDVADLMRAKYLARNAIDRAKRQVPARPARPPRKPTSKDFEDL